VTTRKITPIKDRIERRIEKTAGCWEWTGHINRWGYGLITLPRSTHGAYVNGTPKSIGVHRAAYQVFVGPVPEGMQLDHLCRNRACCNPDHLEPVTLVENLARGESPSAINARKTECVKGHPFDEANTHINPQGHRVCRICATTARRAHARAKAAARRAARMTAQTPAPSPDST